MSTDQRLHYYYDSFGVDCRNDACWICNIRLTRTLEALRDHSNSTTHKQLAEKEFERLTTGAQIAENLGRSLAEIENNRHRINRLGLSRWRWHVVAESNCTANGKCRFPHELLLHYEMKERLSLLELAALKAACIHRQDELQKERGVRPLSNWLEARYYVEHGWKEYRTEMRHSSRVSIIDERVVPFLV